MTISSGLVLVAVVIWASSGMYLGVTDYRTGLLPTRVIWPTAGAVWVLYSAASLIEGEPDGLIGAVLGALIIGGLLAAVHFVHPPSMGFGDVRLSVLNGLMCGWWGWPVAVAALVAGFVLALPEALVTLIRKGPRASRPLGPYLVAGAAVAAAWSIAASGAVPAG